MDLIFECHTAAQLDAAVEMGICDGIAWSGELADLDAQVAALLDAAPGPLFVAAPGATSGAEELLEAARGLSELGDRLVVGLPITEAGLAACATGYEEGLATALGPCETPAQVLLAAKSGATWVTLSLAGLDERSVEVAKVIDDCLQVLSTYDLEAQLLVRDLRHAQHFQDALLAGAHAAVVGTDLIARLLAPR